MADQGSVRALRAVVFTAVCVLLTTVGHGLSAGATPAAAATLVGGALVLLLARHLAGRERSLIEIAGGLLLAQVGLHALFIAVPAADAGAVADAGLAAGSAHSGHHAAASMSVGTVHVHHAGEWMGMGMLLAHLAAGLVAAWWLRQGETAVWRLCRCLAAAAAVPFFRLLSLLGFAPVGDAAPPLARLGEQRPARRAGLVLRHAVIR